MKKVYLLEVRQHNTKRYVGSVDARALVRLACKAELDAQKEPEAQRPINEKRLYEIAGFVAGTGAKDKKEKKNKTDEGPGMLSTSIVIGTCDDRIQVYPAKFEDKDNHVEIPSLFYMNFPETEEEFKKLENAFNIMDGQHRLFSFLNDYNKLADNVPFDITFEMYLEPDLRLRQLIFKNTNEKQEKVASNLLMWFRSALQMLTPREEKYHAVVSRLGNEKEYSSPLRGRIIMGSKKITGGYKAEQIIKILDKSDIQHMGGMSSKALDDETMFKIIRNYLKGWEMAVGSKLADRDKNLGAFSKTAGLRFMILMLPAFSEEASKDRQGVLPEYVSEKIRELAASENIQPRDIFDKNGKYLQKRNDNPFASETTTTQFAKIWISELKSLNAEAYDPFANL